MCVCFFLHCGREIWYYCHSHSWHLEKGINHTLLARDKRLKFNVHVIFSHLPLLTLRRSVDGVPLVQTTWICLKESSHLTSSWKCWCRVTAKNWLCLNWREEKNQFKCFFTVERPVSSAVTLQCRCCSLTITHWVQEYISIIYYFKDCQTC